MSVSETVGLGFLRANFSLPDRSSKRHCTYCETPWGKLWLVILGCVINKTWLTCSLVCPHRPLRRAPLSPVWLSACGDLWTTFMSTTMSHNWTAWTQRHQPIRILSMPLEPFFSCLDSAPRCVYCVCLCTACVCVCVWEWLTGWTCINVIPHELGRTPLS